MENTLQDILDVITKYWSIILFILAIIWSIIKLFFTVKTIKNEHEEMKKALESQIASQEKIRDDLTTLINRNKETTETVARAVQDKLEHIGNNVSKLAGQFEVVTQLMLKEKKK